MGTGLELPHFDLQQTQPPLDLIPLVKKLGGKSEASPSYSSMRVVYRDFLALNSVQRIIVICPGIKPFDLSLLLRNQTLFDQVARREGSFWSVDLKAFAVISKYYRDSETVELQITGFLPFSVEQDDRQEYEIVQKFKWGISLFDYATRQELSIALLTEFEQIFLAGSPCNFRLIVEQLRVEIADYPEHVEG